MIRLRTASALAAGAVAALAIGGTALAADGDSSNPAALQLTADDRVIAAPVPSASTDTAPGSPAPSGSAPSGSSSSAPAASADAISADAAKAIAVKAAGGGQATDIERETEHGRAVWDVEVQTGGVEHDIDVDRATGEVLRQESEADASDATDDSDDSDDRDDTADDDGSDD